MPVDGRGAVKMGPVQRRQMERFGQPKEGEVVKAPLGKGIISSQAAQEYLDKQAAANAV